MLDVAHDDPLVEANTLGIAWAANIGGIATPVGNGTNAAAIGFIAAATGASVTFLQWTMVGSTLAVTLDDPGYGAARVPHQGRRRGMAFERPAASDYITQQRRDLGPMPPAERWAVALVRAGHRAVVASRHRALCRVGRTSLLVIQKNLHLSVPALLVPILMCLVPVPDPVPALRAHVARSGCVASTGGS